MSVLWFSGLLDPISLSTVSRLRPLLGLLKARATHRVFFFQGIFKSWVVYYLPCFSISPIPSVVLFHLGILTHKILATTFKTIYLWFPFKKGKTATLKPERQRPLQREHTALILYSKYSHIKKSRSMLISYPPEPCHQCPGLYWVTSDSLDPPFILKLKQQYLLFNRDYRRRKRSSCNRLKYKTQS